MEDSVPEFTLAEILEMESLLNKRKEESMSEEFYQELAANFSCSTYRIGKSAVSWEQVQSWFQDKQKVLAAKETSSPVAPGSLVPVMSTHAPEKPQKTEAERIAELPDLVFEAKSAKDCAWYDVASFLNYRVLCSGELEVRVRFAGFRNDEDEWVNVKRGVRDRSIPLEASECHRLKVGDLVLCFREKDDHALYSDAYIIEIHRKVHDFAACSCTFVVRYDYDDAVENVQLTRICCRPT